jgi:hypothetical protein
MARKPEPLTAVIIYTPAPDWQDRLRRVFDIILENAARRHAEREGISLEASGNGLRKGMANVSWEK